MKALWWFRDNEILGMARPGFNDTHWFDLSFDEAILMSWIGKYPSGSASFHSWHQHINEYCPKVLKFYNQHEKSADPYIERFLKPAEILKIFERMAERTDLLESFELSNQDIHFSYNPKCINREIQYLKKIGVHQIVSLTERHHNKVELQDHFSLYHIGIKDMEAPTVNQVQQVAQLIEKAKDNHEILAVHCLAGIGRTTTMIIAAHMVLGEKLQKLKDIVAERNPTFILTGMQAEFLESMAKDLRG